MNSLTFNFNRFIQLLKVDLSQNKKRPLIVGAVLFFILSFLVLSLPDEQTGGVQDHEFLNIYYIWYPLILLIGGGIYTANAFNELNEKTGAHHYLTLPASTLEKFVSKWFLTSIGYTLVFTIAYYIATWIINLVSNWMYGASPYAFSLFNDIGGFETESVGLYIKIYLVAQTVSLVGAIIFRKFIVFKTFLANIAIIITFVLVVAILGRILLWDWFDGFSIEPQDINLQPNATLDKFFNGQFESIGWFCLWYVLPIWMLLIGYFKLKEKEV